MNRSLWRKWDILVIGIVFAASFLPVFYWGAQTGQTAVITKDGVEYERVHLDENREFVVEGDFPLTVCIQDGTIFVKESACPDHTCEYTGRVKNAGESIICVPAGVVIRVEGEGTVDAVAQ